MPQLLEYIPPFWLSGEFISVGGGVWIGVLWTNTANQTTTITKARSHECIYMCLSEVVQLTCHYTCTNNKLGSSPPHTEFRSKASHRELLWNQQRNILSHSSLNIDKQRWGGGRGFGLHTDMTTWAENEVIRREIWTRHGASHGPTNTLERGSAIRWMKDRRIGHPDGMPVHTVRGTLILGHER